MISSQEVVELITKKLSLADAPITSNELARRANVPLNMIRHELSDLVRDGKVRSDGRYPCSYWLEVSTLPRTITSFGQAENYDGAELRPFTGRPGSMDAYALPSRGF